MSNQLGQKPQGPIRTFFPKGENAILGVHTFNVIGSGLFGEKTVPPTGLPTGVGSAGVPGVTATFTATGIYDVRFPPIRHVDVDVAVSSSSGYQFHGQLNNQSGPSGSGQLEITRLPAAAGGSSGYHLIQASGFRGFIPTGSKVMLTFYGCPTTDGLTAY
jgi:hypothetical protein